MHAPKHAWAPIFGGIIGLDLFVLATQSDPHIMAPRSVTANQRAGWTATFLAARLSGEIDQMFAPRGGVVSSQRRMRSRKVLMMHATYLGHIVEVERKDDTRSCPLGNGECPAPEAR